MEIKLPEGFDNRGKAIESLIQKEFEAAESELSIIKEGIEKFLLNNKGYLSDEVEKNAKFELVVGDEKAMSCADFIIKLNNRRLMLIKCFVGALASRERQVIACARLIDSYQIPFAIVTDGNHAEVLDTLTGKVIREGIEKIPSREELLMLMEQVELKELSPNRIEKEKRILLAFDAIKCSINSGE
ncbi:MAG: type I restriction enzyme HsdR N-terminal domain-containing protein [Nitrospirae bacterium]|nr:type I restriction enzyme HsdR N-terminal domain-containing protein [Nitrospirota bacterium]